LTTPATIEIRPYREHDRALLEALTIAAFDGVSIDQNMDRLLGTIAARDWRWRKAQHVLDDIAALGKTAEVAVAAQSATDRAVGYVTFHFDREARIGWIHNLAVAAECRGRGLGGRLLEHALERFRAEGMRLAKIETLEQNQTGRHLFPTLGFREVARKIYYAMPLESAGEGGPR
jgi:ribosomal protein S18 acetylase RimI-like enzyme